MTTNTTTVLSNSVRTRYLSDYLLGALGARLYDYFATTPVGKPMKELMAGSSIQVNFLSDLALAESAISQVADVNPIAFRDATASITPTSRANAVQDSELLQIQAFTDYVSGAGAKIKKLGKNQMNSVDLLAQAAALQGTNILRAAARASLDAGTAAHRLTDSSFANAEAIMATYELPDFQDANGMRVPGAPGYVALMHSYPYHDLRTSGNIDDVGHYQDSGIILDFTLGRVGPFQIAVSPMAKVFWGAGADNASSIATTIDADANALATAISVASATNIDVGDHMMIGTEETANTHYPTNERVRVAAVSGTDITIIGAGDNGGLKYDHLSGESVRNADSVYPIVYGGAESLAKLYATENIGPNGNLEASGPYGMMVMPHAQGLVHQFATVGWKFYGGYGRWSESWILRQEVAVSQEA